MLENFENPLQVLKLQKNCLYPLFTSLPMLIKPVLLYSPSHHDGPSSASPLRLPMMLQQGDSGWLLQMRLSSSSNFPLLQNCHPFLAGRWGSTSNGAFSRASFSSSPTSQSAPDLMRFREWVGLFSPVVVIVGRANFYNKGFAFAATATIYNYRVIYQIRLKVYTVQVLRGVQG